MTATAVTSLVERSCAASGVTVEITDLAAVEQIAAVLAAAAAAPVPARLDVTGTDTGTAAAI